MNTDRKEEGMKIFASQVSKMLADKIETNIKQQGNTTGIPPILFEVLNSVRRNGYPGNVKASEAAMMSFGICCGSALTCRIITFADIESIVDRGHQDMVAWIDAAEAAEEKERDYYNIWAGPVCNKDQA